MSPLTSSTSLYRGVRRFQGLSITKSHHKAFHRSPLCVIENPLALVHYCGLRSRVRLLINQSKGITEACRLLVCIVKVWNEDDGCGQRVRIADKQLVLLVVIPWPFQASTYLFHHKISKNKIGDDQVWSCASWPSWPSCPIMSNLRMIRINQGRT